MSDYGKNSSWNNQQRGSATHYQVRDEQVVREREPREQIARGWSTRRSISSNGYSGNAARGGCYLVVACLTILFAVLYVIPHLLTAQPQAQPQQATSHHVTARPTAPLPQLARSYRGTLNLNDSAPPATFTLTFDRQIFLSKSTDTNLKGTATCTPPIAPCKIFSGTISKGKIMNFTLGTFAFTTTLVSPFTSLNGTYTEQGTDHAPRSTGTWKAQATS